MEFNIEIDSSEEVVEKDMQTNNFKLKHKTYDANMRVVQEGAMCNKENEGGGIIRYWLEIVFNLVK